MNYAKIRKNDIANGEGIRVSLFVSGCRFHCPGCFNFEQQSYDYGEPYTEKETQLILSEVRRPQIAGLSLLGGDPLWQTHKDIETLCNLTNSVHAEGKDVWLWTGFKWEDVFRQNPASRNEQLRTVWARKLLKLVDICVDGLFKEELASRFLVWRGSENQRVIDVKKTLEKGEVVLYANIRR